MDQAVIFLDSSILIEYFRKSKKENSYFYKLSAAYSQFAVSIITVFEILVGSNEDQKIFWEEFFRRVEIIDYDGQANLRAIEIYKKLKREANMIGFADLLIGATALAKGMKIATLNKAHFERIENLEIVTGY